MPTRTDGLISGGRGNQCENQLHTKNGHLNDSAYTKLRGPGLAVPEGPHALGTSLTAGSAKVDSVATMGMLHVTL